MLSTLTVIEFAASGGEVVVLNVFMCILAVSLSFFGLTVSSLIAFRKVSLEVIPSRALAGSAKQCSMCTNQSIILKGSLSA